MSTAAEVEPLAVEPSSPLLRVKTWFAWGSAGVALPLNALAIWLILRHTPPVMRVYSKVGGWFGDGPTPSPWALGLLQLSNPYIFCQHNRDQFEVDVKVTSSERLTSKLIVNR
jgi:hypothetical protein